MSEAESATLPRERGGQDAVTGPNAVAEATSGRSGPPVHLGPGGPELELMLAEACCEAFFSTPLTIRCRNLAPGFLAGLLPVAGSGTIHLDDPASAPEGARAEVLAVLEGRLGDWSIPKGWRVAWTGTIA